MADLDRDRIRAAVAGLRTADPGLISEADLRRFLDAGLAALTNTGPRCVQYGLAHDPARPGVDRKAGP